MLSALEAQCVHPSLADLVVIEGMGRAVSCCGFSRDVAARVADLNCLVLQYSSAWSMRLFANLASML